MRVPADIGQRTPDLQRESESGATGDRRPASRHEDAGRAR